MKKYIILALLLPVLAVAADSGTAIKASDIKAEAFNDAKTVATLKRGARVEILNKSGGWMQVRAGPHQGWVRMLNIRRGAAQPNLDLPGVVKLANGRSATGNITATTGIRGLSAQDLKSAAFDENALKEMESYTVTRDAAQQFARQQKRQARPVDYLPVPKGRAS